MFSDKMKTRVMGLALAGAVFAVPAAASAEGVVVKSTGPSASTYPVGRKVADGASITLRAGDRITVLTDAGTSVMQGPGTFRVGEGATRTRARFSNLTRRSASRRARTGAVRGTGDGVARSPNLWFVNVAAAGTVCLYDMSAIRLWRPSAEEAQTYSIVDQGTQTALDVTFVGTEAVRALDPEVITINAGTEYSILAPALEGDNEERPTVNVRFVTLEEEYETPDALAAALIENGCTTQLGLLADTLEGAVR